MMLQLFRLDVVNLTVVAAEGEAAEVVVVLHLPIIGATRKFSRTSRSTTVTNHGLKVSPRYMLHMPSQRRRATLGANTLCKDNVDNEGQWYSIEGHLFYWQSYYGLVFVMNIWEQDGSEGKIKSVTYNGKTYGIECYDSDDDLGSNPVGFDDPPAMSCDFYKGYYDTGDAEYRMRYQGRSASVPAK